MADDPRLGVIWHANAVVRLSPPGPEDATSRATLFRGDDLRPNGPRRPAAHVGVTRHLVGLPGMQLRHGPPRRGRFHDAGSGGVRAESDADAFSEMVSDSGPNQRVT